MPLLVKMANAPKCFGSRLLHIEPLLPHVDSMSVALIHCQIVCVTHDKVIHMTARAKLAIANVSLDSNAASPFCQRTEEEKSHAPWTPKRLILEEEDG